MEELFKAFIAKGAKAELDRAPDILCKHWFCHRAGFAACCRACKLAEDCKFVCLNSPDRCGLADSK